MTARRLLTDFWKLLVSILAFITGMALGGIFTSALGLQPPALPAEVDGSQAAAMMLSTSPLLILALCFINKELAGNWLVRGSVLFFLSWVAYSLNNVIEATIFTTYETASWFTVITFMPALLLSALVVAWLFPSRHQAKSIQSAWQERFQARPPSSWRWRLPLAAVSFMPIYYFFGLLVVPLVGEYYEQGMAGLAIPPLGTLLAVLFLRSLLFFMACLPVAVAWQGTRPQLILTLGFALFVLVGLLYMLAASWIAPQIRLFHSLEILADSFVYAAVFVWLCVPTPHARHLTGLERVLG